MQTQWYIFLLNLGSLASGLLRDTADFRLSSSEASEIPMALPVKHPTDENHTKLENRSSLKDPNPDDEDPDNLVPPNSAIESSQEVNGTNRMKPLKAFTEAEFQEEMAKDLDAVDPNLENIPSSVVQVKRKPNKDSQGSNKRDLDAPVSRWEHQSGLSPEDSEGCGAPLCANVDGRPKRFQSWCQLSKWMMSTEHIRRFLQIQKGDCANAIESKGLDWPWGEAPKSCQACQANIGCREAVCVESQGKAATFNNICEAMQALHGAKEVVTMHFALGDCEALLNENTCLHTEWFDVDEPCKEGDMESGTQNMAMVSGLDKTGRFRMCPKIRQTGDVQFRTIEGGEVPKDQKVWKDFEAQRLVCKNDDQTSKPGPPNHWFELNIRCRDYKMRHCCKCMFGCYPKEDGGWKMDTPQVEHLYDECEWMPFISQETPRSDTWDAEDRATALTTGQTSKHVCGGNIFDAIYIDARTRADDVPWDETGEIITKNTPSYGFLCINKNNKPFSKRCSDYKVRYCCLKKRPAHWGEWSDWTDCSKSCGGGIRSRDRVCNSKKGNKETCFGNWPDKDESGRDRHAHLKHQEHVCNVLSCPGDANFMEWMAWETCPITCGQAQKRRRRGCNPPTYGGTPCPSDRSQYEQFVDCKLPQCLDPLWTTWTTWTSCSSSCGLGKRRRGRKCEDVMTKEPMQPGLDCIGGTSEAIEECKLTDCPIDGSWTEWQNWGTCSVLCGRQGHRVRQRYCSNPIPQFGGQTCPGNDEERGPCPNLTPCPLNCEWSEWGIWSPCSVTCGNPGDGLETRGRHIHQEAKYGGCKCTEKNTENRICQHEKMASSVKTVPAKDIYYCPIDCLWGEWTSWSTCPDCFGESSGYFQEDLQDFEQVRTRKVERQRKYRGKKCTSSIEMDTLKGQCTPASVPPCPEVAGASFTTQWGPWTTCVAQCGKRGKRRRRRQCVGDACNGDLEETEPCSGFCPPEGWSQWDMWSNCPVTCGSGQRARIRYCRDDKKDEMKGRETCRGVARETQKCDMGQCGSVTPVQDIVKDFAQGQMRQPTKVNSPEVKGQPNLRGSDSGQRNNTKESNVVVEEGIEIESDYPNRNTRNGLESELVAPDPGRLDDGQLEPHDTPVHEGDDPGRDEGREDRRADGEYDDPEDSFMEQPPRRSELQWNPPNQP